MRHGGGMFPVLFKGSTAEVNYLRSNVFDTRQTASGIDEPHELIQPPSHPKIRRLYLLSEKVRVF